jgi:uncharacterized protein
MSGLPSFTYHPDPLASGSVTPSDTTCRCCGQARGYVYTGPVYSEQDDLDDALCPWCIADGQAARKFDAAFVDSEAFAADLPDKVMDEICLRTPGYSSWQQEVWPVCCDDATQFLRPTGIQEIRRDHYQLEGLLMPHIVYELGISGGAANRLLDSLKRDQSPTAYIFQCRHCLEYKFHIDGV